MRKCQPHRKNEPLPALWLISDARNDAVLERALARLPRGAGFIFRHWHLPPAQRRDRFRKLARIARSRSMIVILAGEPRLAREWKADGSYGPACRTGQLRLATAHCLREIASANRSHADAALLSPVFPTRSHPGAPAMGSVRFRLIAMRSAVPVIALGGLTASRVRRLQWDRWAAIDGLSPLS